MRRRLLQIEIGLGVVAAVALVVGAILVVRSSQHLPIEAEVEAAANSPDAEQLLTKWGSPQRIKLDEDGRPGTRLQWKIVCRDAVVEVTSDEVDLGETKRLHKGLSVHPRVDRWKWIDRFLR